MKTSHSLRGKLERAQGNFWVNRGGSIQIRNKLFPKFNCKQKNNTLRRKRRSMLGK